MPCFGMGVTRWDAKKNMSSCHPGGDQRLHEGGCIARDTLPEDSYRLLLLLMLGINILTSHLLSGNHGNNKHFEPFLLHACSQLVGFQIDSKLVCQFNHEQ